MKCELCDLDFDFITKHHLIPKTRHSNKKIKKQYTSLELSKTINLCLFCHCQIHKFFDEKELSIYFNSKLLLLENDKVKKYLFWHIKKNKGLKNKG